jgi:hypothetical protein
VSGKPAKKPDFELVIFRKISFVLLKFNFRKKGCFPAENQVLRKKRQGNKISILYI